jgi:hypothetical protein
MMELSANLFWTDNSVAPDTATSFTYEWKPTSGSAWSLAVTGSTSVTVTGLLENTAYDFRVRANNSVGSSSYATSVPGTTKINAPTGLSVSASGTTVNLSWTDNSTVETGYQVERSSNGGTSYTLVATTAAGATTYADTNRPDGTYKYRVRAWVSANFTGSDWLTQAGTVTVASVPATPTGLSVDGVGTTRVDLAWSDVSADETGFVIERRLLPSGTFSQVASIAADTVSYRDTTVLESRQYEYRVAATNAAGTSGYSNTVSTWTVPAAPTMLDGFGTFTSVFIQWIDNSSGNTGYRIERRVPNGTFALLANIGTGPFDNLGQYSDSNIPTGTTYEYRVAATNSQYTSGWSNTFTVTTDGGLGFNPGVPAAPSGLTATATSSSTISLAWTDNATNETGFGIEQSTDNTNWNLISDDEVGINGNSYQVTLLSASTLYYFRVRAQNEAGWSAASNTASATTQSGSLSPSWTLDFSSGSPWANGTDYNYTSTRTAGTYVDSSGYIATSVANLVQYSEDMSDAWWNGGGGLTPSVIASPAAPDNTATTNELVETATNVAHHEQRNTVTIDNAKDYTFSAYLKKSTRQYAGLSVYTFTTTAHVIFDLTAGTVSAQSGNATNRSATITDVGNGWYRCTLSFTSGGTAGSTQNTYPSVFTSDRAGFTGTLSEGKPVFMGSTSESVYVWGLQIVLGSAALPYSKTTTAANGIPRITHNSSGTRLGLLVEEQRTNIALATENFTDTGRWPVTNATAADTTNTAPDNGSDAESITEVAATSANYRIRSGAMTTGVAAGDTFTASCFIKDAPTNGKGYGYVSVAIDGGTSRVYTVIVNLSTGALETTMTSGSPAGTAYTIENYGNGWYRVSATATAQTGATGVRVLMGMWQSGATNSSGYPAYTVTAGNEKSILAWGAQIEEGATPTSYLANTAITGSGVTRSADLAHVLDSAITSWGDPGALVVHFYPPGQAGTILSTDDASTAQVGIKANSTTTACAFWSSGETSTGTIGTGVQKAVHYWNGSTSKFAINGSTPVSDTNNLTIGNTDFVTLGAEATDSSGVPGTFSQYANCVIRKVEFYSGTLTDANLQTITT